MVLYTLVDNNNIYSEMYRSVRMRWVGAWSMVYVGCTGNVPQATTNTEVLPFVTVVGIPRLRIEKPYIVMKKTTNDEEKFELHVPKAKWSDDVSYTIDPKLDGADDEIVRDFTSIRVVRDTEPITRIQEALNDGKDVVLCRGIYPLQESRMVRHPNQILYGLGLATLEAPKDGSPCICVALNTPGVRLAGLMLEATVLDDLISSDSEGMKKESSALLIWGEEGCRDSANDASNRENPSAMFDIYIRAGGAAATRSGKKTDRTKIAVSTLMYIHSDYVIGDNLWLWRADHAELDKHEVCNYPNISSIFWQTESDEYPVNNGLVVTGNDVTIFGLAVEHTNSHQTIWSGERGAVYFYQCELPYDTTTTNNETQDATQSDNRSNSIDGAIVDICGFRIEQNVQEHELYAPGIYSNFRNAPLYAVTGIEHPNNPGVKVVNPFTVNLDNLGGIKSIVNGRGKATYRQGIPVRLQE